MIVTGQRLFGYLNDAVDIGVRNAVHDGRQFYYDANNRLSTGWHDFKTAPVLPIHRAQRDLIVDVVEWGVNTAGGIGGAIYDAAPLALPAPLQNQYLAAEQAGALPNWAPRPNENLIEPIGGLLVAGAVLDQRIRSGDTHHFPWTRAGGPADGSFGWGK